MRAWRMLVLCGVVMWGGEGCNHSAPAAPPNASSGTAVSNQQPASNINAYQQHRHGKGSAPVSSGNTP